MHLIVGSLNLLISCTHVYKIYALWCQGNLVCSNSSNLSLWCCAFWRFWDTSLPWIWSKGLPMPCECIYMDTLHGVLEQVVKKIWFGKQNTHNDFRCIKIHLGVICYHRHVDCLQSSHSFEVHLTSMLYFFSNCSLNFLAFFESLSSHSSSSRVHTSVPQNRQGPEPSYITYNKIGRGRGED